MKIAYHHRTKGRGAQGIHIREIVEAFRELGHQVDILSLTNKNPGQHQSAEADSGGKSTKSSLSVLLKKWFALLYNIPGYLYLRNKVSKGEFDFIYERYSLYNYAGIKTAKKLELPLVLEVNSPYAHKIEEYEKPLFHPLAKKVEKKIIKEADIVITVSDSLKKYLSELGIAKDKITVMHNGVNFDKFDHNIPGNKIREKYSLMDRKVIGFVGGIEKHHGLDTLVRAAAKVDNKDDLALLLLGNGSYKEKLEQLADKLNLKVIFPGRVAHKKVPDYIAAMDVAVKPDANFYCSPMKLFEYMAMKKPIIAGDTPSVREIIDDGKTGLVVKPEVDGLKRGLKKLLSNSELTDKLADSGYKYVKKNYSWQENAGQVIELVKELKEGGE